MAAIVILIFVVLVSSSWAAPADNPVIAPPSRAPTADTQAPTADTQAPPADTQAPTPCPAECTCHEAPLHAAPFVHTWMRTWAQSEVPTLDENDVLDQSAVAASHGPAEDAGVDVAKHGLHATCALYPDTNLTQTVQQLPQRTMVLTVLQAAGCGYTVIEGDQLASLTNLRALHIQGFAPHQRKDLEKFSSEVAKNTFSKREKKGKQTQNGLSMVLADDALKSLVHLEILDLQFVHLTAKEDAQRQRRHTWGPISTTTMVDMPLRKFLRYADDLDEVNLPLDLKNQEREHITSDLIKLEKISEKKFEFETNEYEDNFDVNGNEAEDIREELSVVLLDTTEREEPVPYEIYQSVTKDLFTPFTSLTALKYLRIAHAHLDKLGPELLAGLRNLHTFTLEYNHIRILPADVFAPTPNIRHLSIAHNSLLSLDSNSLQGLTNLVTLDLEYNKVAIIGPGTFPHLPNLRSLALEGNPLKHILPDSFIVVNATDTLTIGCDHVTTRIHGDAFRQLSNLKTLRIMNISSESFGESLFSNIPQLEDLTLHGVISTIDYDAFTSTPNLKNLDISRCSLSRISVDAFFGLSQLIRLDISHNKLSDLNPGVFDHLLKLTELYLHHNKLSTLPVGIFTPLRVTVLRLNHNPWDCSCNLLQLHPTLTNRITQSGYSLGTNRITQFGYTICKRDTKHRTVCDKVADRVVFDARVAPKCSTPLKFRNKDVYSVAERYLKCSKYRWDPLLYTETPLANSANPAKPRKLPSVASAVINTDEVEEEIEGNDQAESEEWVVNWRPLADYTPVPIRPLDLLNIAEIDRLEEADVATTLGPKLIRTEAILQDETTLVTKEEQKRRMALSLAEYRANKNKVKQQLRLHRAREVQRLLMARLFGKIVKT